MNFKIEWTDPKTGEYQTENREFNDSESIRAIEWAEDYAYMLADKGWHQVTPLPRR